MADKTNLQQLLLNVLYRDAYRARDKACSEVNACLFDLDQARKNADARQVFLERVAAEVRASGYGKAEDYLNRIWPERRPDEEPCDRNHMTSFE